MPLEKLAVTIKDRLGAVVRGKVDPRSSAFVESTKRQLQQPSALARGCCMAEN